MTHASAMFLSLADCEKLHAGKTGSLSVASDAGKTLCCWALPLGKPRVAYVGSQRQYCVSSEDRHRFSVPRNLDL